MIPDFSILREFGLVTFLILFIIFIFVYLFKTVIKQWTDQSAVFATVIQNHLSHSTQAMNDTCKVLTDLKNEVGSGFKDNVLDHKKIQQINDDILREIKLK